MTEVTLPPSAAAQATRLDASEGEPTSALSLRQVTIWRRELCLVEDLSLDLEAGMTLGVAGPSGCGKTTLLRVLAGTTSDFEGTVSRPAKRLACVFQEPRLLPWRSALDNVLLPLDQSREARLHAITWLDRVGLADASGLYPAQMSGGMRQRVAIARALATEPGLLLVDEPFASLDAALSERLRTDLAALITSTDLTTVWVSHDRDELTQVADRHLDLDGPPGSWRLTERR
ncbi:MAG: ATP-binding cassette domain-containing protein [Bowdeniella nasicola]|nr:ATP-binding cassette domain-containing protein [Bowdeniella nasicola]